MSRSLICGMHLFLYLLISLSNILIHLNQSLKYIFGLYVYTVVLCYLNNIGVVDVVVAVM